MTRPLLRHAVVAIIVLIGLAGSAGVARAQNPPETIEYYATDALGSVRVVFTPTGQVIGRSDYLPFGDTLNQSGALPRQRFTGQERDGEAGLDYFNARSLQMRTGRMNRPDPVFGDALTNPQRWNRYAYALNNPLKYTDPTGMDAYDLSHTAALNAWYQEFWGVQAWDDFSQDYWAQGTGYSYGPFSPRELYNSAFKPRDDGGGGEGQSQKPPTPVVTTQTSVVLPDGSVRSIEPPPPVLTAPQARRSAPAAPPGKTWFVAFNVTLIGATGGEGSVGIYWDRDGGGAFGSFGPGAGLNIGATVNLGSVNTSAAGFAGEFKEVAAGVGPWGATLLFNGNGPIGTVGSIGVGATPVAGSVAVTTTGIWQWWTVCRSVFCR
jgi:RHS repeat-associated protein